MKIYDVEAAKQTILKRGTGGLPEQGKAEERVKEILADVLARGDAAVNEWAARLDGRPASGVRVPGEELDAALAGLTSEARAALDLAAERIRRFHQMQPVATWTTQELGGRVGQLVRPLRRVGLYVPAGTAPLPSSVLMSAIPAQVAGVREIVIATPPDRKTGKVSPVTLAAAALVGVREVYALGGAQAIAALAYGTETIPAVDKICGPGNLYVTLAKRLVFGTVGIDGLAGPTETVVIADAGARPGWVAADLLAQAEHDLLAAAILLTPSRELAEAVQAAVTEQVESLGRAEIVAKSLVGRSGIVVTEDLAQAVALANAYAPEHLCLALADPWPWVEKITSAGGVFVGEQSCEVLGDYVAGPSHVMPTGGSARFASPLNVLDFVHIVSLIGLDRSTVSEIAPSAARIARMEGLDAHARAAEARQ
jgi:histidinol dehydrogenase